MLLFEVKFEVKYAVKYPNPARCCFNCYIQPGPILQHFTAFSGHSKL